jgi:hypothetical protein
VGVWFDKATHLAFEGVSNHEGGVRMSTGLRARLLVGTILTVAVVLAVATPALAQVPDPAPDGSLPGGALITQVLGWLKYAAIAAAVAGLLIGGVATGVGHFGSNYSASSAGRKWVLGGIGAAMIAGLAHTIAMTVYNAT